MKRTLPRPSLKRTPREQLAAFKAHQQKIDERFLLGVKAYAPLALHMAELYKGNKDLDRYKKLQAAERKLAWQEYKKSGRPLPLLMPPPEALAVLTLPQRPTSVQTVHYQTATALINEAGPPDPENFVFLWNGKYPQPNEWPGVGLMGFGASLRDDIASPSEITKPNFMDFVAKANIRQVVETTFTANSSGITVVEVNGGSSLFPIFHINEFGYGSFNLKTTMLVGLDLIDAPVEVSECVLHDEVHSSPFNTVSGSPSGAQSNLYCVLDAQAGRTYRIKVYMDCSIRVWHGWYRSPSGDETLYVNPARVSAY